MRTPLILIFFVATAATGCQFHRACDPCSATGAAGCTEPGIAARGSFFGRGKVPQMPFPRFHAVPTRPVFEVPGPYVPVEDMPLPPASDRELSMQARPQAARKIVSQPRDQLIATRPPQVSGSLEPIAATPTLAVPGAAPR